MYHASYYHIAQDGIRQYPPAVGEEAADNRACGLDSFRRLYKYASVINASKVSLS